MEPSKGQLKRVEGYLHTHVHCSIFHDSQKVEATQMSINRCMDTKMWYIHTIEYYSSFKRKEILTHATTWINLKDKP